MARLLNHGSPGARGIPVAEILAAADACDAAADARSEQEQMDAFMRVMGAREHIRLVLLNRKLERLAAMRPPERSEMILEGDSIGWHRSRIPEDLAFQLAVQPNFGWEGLGSEEGIRDIHRAHPFTKCKYVPRRPTFAMSWRRGRARKAAATYGRGTLDLR